MADFNFASTSNASLMLGPISYVFYVNSDSNIAYLWYTGKEYKRKSPSGSDVLPYESRTIFLKNNPIKIDPNSPQITAISYKTGDDLHVRVYYVNADGLLRELCFDTTDPNKEPVWYRGALTDQNLSADPKTALTALVQVGGVDQLKVYYKTNHKNFFNVAYANINDDNWSTREIFNAGSKS